MGGAQLLRVHQVIVSGGCVKRLFFSNSSLLRRLYEVGFFAVF
jgi:hypothetical protein